VAALTYEPRYWDAVTEHMTTRLGVDADEARRRVQEFVDAIASDPHLSNPDFVYHASATSIAEDLARRTRPTQG
jgi:hypothetical protein